ncbi:MAG: metallophosphoesterase, partial [Spartobacteria bacterium]
MIHPAQGVSALQSRMGTELHAKRLKRQHDKLTKFLHQGRGIFRIERLLPFDLWLSRILHLTGLKKRMRADFLDVRLVEMEWFFPNLPPSFEGYRLLHLTDLHCDLDPALLPVGGDLARRTPHAAAVLTGDYRNGMEGDHVAATRAMADLRKALAPDCWGILGNHDPLEMVLELERDGLPILLNETVEIGRGADSLWIAGVDDPHYFQSPSSRRISSQAAS